MTNQVVRASLTLSVWLDCASRRGIGDLDRAVDFSQQNDALLFYRGRKAADKNYYFIAKPRRLRAFPKHR